MCRECDQFAYDDLIKRVYYKDDLCLVFKGDNGEVISIYGWHYTPIPKHQKWVALKGEIYAKKIFGQDFVMAYEYQDHYKVIYKPKPSNKIM